MKLFNDLISEDLGQAIGWTLVHAVWQLLLVSSLLWLMLKVGKKSTPALKYGISVGALMISFMAVLGTFYFQLSQTVSSPEFEVGNGNFLWPIQDQSAQKLTWEIVVAKATFQIESNLPILVNFWLLGAILFIFRWMNSLSGVRNLRKNAVLMEDFEVTKMSLRLAGKLGISRGVEIRTTAFAQSPLTFGMIRPVILLPAALIFHLSPAQLEAIIAHELAHVKRNDYLSNLLLSALEILFFFHPCYWWMNQTVRELRENAADDLALRAGIQPKVLATSLVEVLNFAKQTPPELSLAATQKRNPTLLRIKRMLGYPTENYPQTPIISIPMLLTLFLSAGLIAGAQLDTNMPFTSTEKPSVAQSVDIPEIMDTVKVISGKPIGPDTLQFKRRNLMVFTDESGKTFRFYSDFVVVDGDTVVLSEELKEAYRKMRIPMEEMPILEIPLPQVPIEPFFGRVELDTIEVPVNTQDLGFDNFFKWSFISSDTSKAGKEERERWIKEIEVKAVEQAKQAEKLAREQEMKAKEQEAEWREKEAMQREKIAELEARFQEEFQPKMKDLEAKIKALREANEPRIKEFELKMKEWEATQKPKMEEFKKKVEEWKKEYESELEEFQKLIKEEFQKEKN